VSVAYVRAVERHLRGRLRPVPWQILQTVAWLADDHGRWQGSLDDIAAHTGLHRVTVSRNLVHLAADGWLDVTRTGRQNILDLSPGPVSELAERYIESKRNAKSEQRSAKSVLSIGTTSNQGQPVAALAAAGENRRLVRDEHGYLYVADQQLTMEV
jgi:hypothetical protein